jgi:bacterioferritin
MTSTPILDKLNAILRHEWTGVAQYAQAGFVIQGLWRPTFSKKFFKSAEESFGHAKRIGDKIVALGGVPTVERNPIKQSDDLIEMLNNALAFEQGAVDLYKEALAIADKNDRALVVLLEDILLEEQDGVDEITQLLREQKGAAAKSGKSSSKAG